VKIAISQAAAQKPFINSINFINLSTIIQTAAQRQPSLTRQLVNFPYGLFINNHDVSPSASFFMVSSVSFQFLSACAYSICEAKLLCVNCNSTPFSCDVIVKVISE
jgi:hypothetical protein